MGRRIFALAALSALVLALAGSSRAQSQSTASKSAQASTPASAKVATANTAPGTQATTPKPAAGPAALAGQSAPKGQQEGIKVHGHWTIEVKNPDGKVATHREFENALVSGVTGGAALLAGILGRVVTPGSWSVLLSDDAGQTSIIEINEPGSPPASGCPHLVLSLNSGTCSTNLSVTGPQLSSGAIYSASLNGGTLTLSGSGTVPQNFPAAIGYAATNDFVCVASASPTTCSTTSGANALQGFFTARPLDGNTPAGLAAGDPNPVPVTPGQTVNVTVTISFQ